MYALDCLGFDHSLVKPIVPATVPFLSFRPHLLFLGRFGVEQAVGAERGGSRGRLLGHWIRPLFLVGWEGERKKTCFG